MVDRIHLDEHESGECRGGEYVHVSDYDTLAHVAHVVAMLALQSERYGKDWEYRDAVDDLLAVTGPEIHGRTADNAKASRCTRQKAGEYNMLSCCLEWNHEGPCNFVVSD